MRLKRVEPNNSHRYDGIKTKCGCCNCYRTINDITTMYADLDGPPYSSYYCEQCVKEIGDE